MTDVLEWWPDYGGGPLWAQAGRGGKLIDLASLDLPVDLAERLTLWNADYSQEKLPIDGTGDREWIERGTRLLCDTRSELAGRFDIVVSEPWWGEPPVD